MGRSYLAITPPSNFKTLNNTQAIPGLNGIIGLKQAQSGGVYDPADVQIVNRPNGATTIESKDTGVQTGQQFAGRAQPKFVPAADPGFFFDGQCTASAGNGATGITAHTCTLNLCLGGGGYNCLALYCGSAFILIQPRYQGIHLKMHQSYHQRIHVLLLVVLMSSRVQEDLWMLQLLRVEHLLLTKVYNLVSLHKD